MRTVGVDVGGTFTDIVAWDGTSVTTAKVLTTADPADGIAANITEPLDHLVHGTTAATNALLERDGAATVLVTTPGFEDAIEIGRQDRPSLYDGAVDRPAPLVARGARLGSDRIDELEAAAPEAVAVCLAGGIDLSFARGLA